MPSLRLNWDRTSFRGGAGDEIKGSGYRLDGEAPRDVHTFKVAGTSHRRDELQSALFAPGRELALVAEPDNPHDPNAVGIWDVRRTRQVGYVPRELARLIKRRLAHERIERAISLWEWRQSGTEERIGLEVLAGPQMTVEMDR